MKTWLLAVAWMPLTLVGCRTDPAIALLERDNRLKEDEIFRLRGQVEDLQEALQCAAPVVVGAPVTSGAQAGIGTTDPKTIVGPDLRPSTPPAAGVAPRAATGMTKPGPGGLPRVSPAPAAKQLPPDVPQVPPKIRVEPGPPGPSTDLRIEGPDVPNEPRGVPPGTTDRREPAPRSSSDVAKTGALTMHRAPGRAPGAAPSVKVARVTLNKSLTGFYHSGETPGERRLRVVVEPRDSSDRILAAPAGMSVAVFDPALPKDAPPVARWHVSAAQAAQLAGGGEAPGVHLNLAWPSTPRAHDALQLYVQYKTADGRQFQVDRPIQAAVAGKPPLSLPLTEGPPLEPGAKSGSSWQQAVMAGPAANSRPPNAGGASGSSPSNSTWTPNRTPTLADRSANASLPDRGWAPNPNPPDAARAAAGSPSSLGQISNLSPSPGPVPGLMKTGTGYPLGAATDSRITGSEPPPVAVPGPGFTGFSSGQPVPEVSETEPDTPRVATRPAPLAPQRPVWSPERR